MQIETVGVVGCGLMGHGIAQIAAQGGHNVIVAEADQDALDKGLSRIEKSLAKLAEKLVEKGCADRSWRPRSRSKPKSRATRRPNSHCSCSSNS